MKTESNVRIGPAGWSYEDWKGIIYPPGMREHPLGLLSRLFDTVEVNSTFYRPPNPSYCAGWLRKVVSNDRFRFTLKLWRRFTHERDQPASPEEVRLVREGLEPLVEGRCLGAVLVQFPWHFKLTAPNQAWLAGVLDTFAELPLVVEVRHASWNLSLIHI